MKNVQGVSEWFVARNKANAAIRDRDGLLPLHHAVVHSNQHVIDVLLSHSCTALTVGAFRSLGWPRAGSGVVRKDTHYVSWPDVVRGD